MNLERALLIILTFLFLLFLYYYCFGLPW